MLKNTLCVFALMFWAFSTHAQNPYFFQKIDPIENLRTGAQRDVWPAHYQTYRLDAIALRMFLEQAPAEGSAPTHTGHQALILPDSGGKAEKFAVWQTPTLAPELAAAYPSIRTFAGVSLETPGKTLYGSLTERGFRAVILNSGHPALFVEPLTWGQAEYCILYEDGALPLKKPHSGDFPSYFPEKTQLYTPPVEARGPELAPVVLRTFRLAVAATGEFTQDHGGTVSSGLAAVTEYVNMVNAVYERDLAIRFQLIGTNNKVIYTDPAADPFTGLSSQALATTGRTQLELVFGNNAYDVGHVFGRGGGGVSLGLGTVCGGGKAGGASLGGGANTYGNDFVYVICQEIGHQFSAQHTWNRCGGGAGDQRAGISAFEPGSGSTIMSYVGGCGPDNVQNEADLYFHAGSVEQIRRFVELGLDIITCGAKTATINTAPVVTLPYQDNFFIPILTPFELTGSATDAEKDALTYCWEEIDAGAEIALGQQVGNSAAFRSRPPVPVPNRYFPRLITVLNNGSDRTEILPAYTRDLTFRLTARDNRPGGGGVGWADVAFKAFQGAGPFLVGTPNAADQVWRVGEYTKVGWDVANTDKAPVNCAKVNIRLSTDGGLTWPIVLASGVDNDGEHYVLVPNNPGNTMRVRIDAADNVFYDVSNANFSIQAPERATYTLSLSDDFETVCLPNTFSTNILSAGTLGFSTAAKLDLQGDLPPGATASFSNQTLNPNATAVLNIDLSKVTVEGTYTFNLRAIVPDHETFIRAITLNLIRNDFKALALKTPADGETNTALTQTLRWNAVPDAESYDVQLARSPAFNPADLVTSRSGTAIDSFKINVLLDKGTGYYWRVRPRNSCGVFDWTEPFFFSTFAQSCRVLGANDLPKTISANGTPTVESKITVNAASTILDLNIRQIKGFHSFFKDLEVVLISPQGTEVGLFKNKCGNYNGFFRLGFDDAAPGAMSCPPPNNGAAYRAENPLSAFNGQNAEGAWTLRIKDNTSSSGGALDSFQLEFCGATTINPPFLVRNNILPVTPATISAAVNTGFLLVQDADNSPAELTFTLLTVPLYGKLEKNAGAALKPGDTFTQANLDAGIVRYVSQIGNQPEDYFKFTVSDGRGGFLGTTKFTIRNLSVGVQNPEWSELQFVMSPNPASGQVRLQFGQTLASDAQLRLFDTSGRLLRIASVQTGLDAYTWMLENIPAGIYVVRVETRYAVGVKKLVLKK